MLPRWNTWIILRTFTSLLSIWRPCWLAPKRGWSGTGDGFGVPPYLGLRFVHKMDRRGCSRLSSVETRRGLEPRPPLALRRVECSLSNESLPTIDWCPQWKNSAGSRFVEKRVPESSVCLFSWLEGKVFLKMKRRHLGDNRRQRFAAERTSSIVGSEEGRGLGY